MNCSRFTLAIASVVIAGCSAAQPPIGAPDAVPQSQISASATHAKRGGSWMLREAKNENLIYLGDRSSVLVYSYRGKQVGSIEALPTQDSAQTPKGTFG